MIRLQSLSLSYVCTLTHTHNTQHTHTHIHTPTHPNTHSRTKTHTHIAINIYMQNFSTFASSMTQACHNICSQVTMETQNLPSSQTVTDCTCVITEYNFGHTSHAHNYSFAPPFILVIAIYACNKNAKHSYNKLYSY